MPITVECPCGKKLKAGENAAGKTAKCPACGNPITVPSPASTDRGIDLSASDPFANHEWEKPRPTAATVVKPVRQAASPQPDVGDDGRTTLEPDAPSVAPATKSCPFCGEEVLAVAKKCKHCNEFLDPSLRQAHEAPKWNPGIAALLSLLLPGAGQMYKGQVGTGIIQLIGCGFAYAKNIPFGACLHLAVVIHAAVKNPNKRIVADSQPQHKPNPVGLIVVILLGLACIAAILFASYIRDMR